MDHHDVTFADEEIYVIRHFRTRGLRFAKLIPAIRKCRVVLYAGIGPVAIDGGALLLDEVLTLCSFDQFFVSHVLNFSVFHQEHSDVSHGDAVLAELRRPRRALPQRQLPCHTGTSAAACF